MSSPVVARIGGIGLALLAGLSHARAQDLDAGKTPAQLFASHCSACHRAPQGLVKQSFGLSRFLRQHYTSSPATADALAAYVAAAGPDPRAARTSPGVPGAPRTGSQAAPAPVGNGGDPRILREPAGAQPGTAQSAEPPKPRPTRDPRLAVAVSGDPQPFLIVRDPLPVPPDQAPRRVPPAQLPAAPELRPTTPETTAMAPTARGAGDRPAAATTPSSDPAATTTGAGGTAPAPDSPGKVTADQPTFSAPLP